MNNRISQKELYDALAMRHGADNQEKFSQATVNIFGLGGLGVLKYENNILTGSLVKFLNEEIQKQLLEIGHVKDGDIILIASGAFDRVCFLLGSLRCKYARELGLIKPNTYDLLYQKVATKSTEI